MFAKVSRGNYKKVREILQVIKPERDRGAVRIDADVMEAIMEEQSRLRKVEGKRPTYSQLIRRMWDAYAGKSPDPIPVPVASTDPSVTPRTATERRIIAAVLQFLRDAETIEMRPILTALLDWCADRPQSTRKPAQNTNEKDLSK